MFRNLSLAFVLGVMMLFIVSGAMGAEEDVLDELSLYELRNLEITVATKTKTTVQDAPSIVSVITGEEIKNMGARSIVDVLRTIPGFDITDAIVMPVHQINIRGMRSASYSEKVKIMINGHNTGIIDGHNGMFFDVTPLANISRIEIIRGPGSALYGTGAFLGVINIITKKGDEGSSEISMEAGSYGTAKPSGRFSYKKEDFKTSLYAEYYTTDGYDGVIESDMASNSPIFASAAPEKMTGDVNNYTFQTDISYKNLDFSASFQKFNSNIPVGVARVLTDENDVNYLYGYGEVGYKLQIKENLKLNFRAFYDYADVENHFEMFPEETAALAIHTGFPSGESPRAVLDVKLSSFGGEITADYKPHSDIQLVTGASYEFFEQYDLKMHSNYNLTGKSLKVGDITYPAFPYQWFPYQDVSEDGNYNEPADRTVIALYGQGIIDLKDMFSLKKGVRSLSLTAGIRYDNYDDFGDTVNPRCGLVYAPTEKLYFKALYGTAFRAPSWKELYNKNNPSQKGNPNLDPEKISTMEGLIGYNFTKNIKSSLTFFDVRAKDLIQQAADTVYYNIGEMQSRGVEAEVRFLFGRKKYAYANATWQDVKDTTNATITSAGGQTYTQKDFNPGSVPEFYGNAGLNYDLNDYMSANLSLTYIGERDRSEAMKWDGENLVRADRRDPTKDCTLFNASLTFANIWKGWEFQVSGFNLFDSDHRVPDSTGALYYDMPQPGRWGMFKVSYSF